MAGEIITSKNSATADSTLRSRVGKTLRRIVRGIYTPNLTDPLEAIVARNWTTIAGLALPGAVVTDRSARRGSPTSGSTPAVPPADRPPKKSCLPVASR